MSPRFLDAVRHPPAIVSRIEVWSGGQRVDPYGNAGLPVYGGEVQIDGSKLIRRTLANVKVDVTDETWELLSPPGTELHCFRGFRYLNGESELIPVGHFLLEDLDETYGGDWSGTVDTASDLMVKVDRARFITPRSFSAGERIADVIATLLSEVLGPVTNLSTSDDVLTSAAVYDRDRAKAISDLATSIAASVFVAPDGTPMIVDQPQIGDPVWNIDAGDDGVLYQAVRRRSLSQAYSAVVALPSGVDGSAPFDPQIVYDTDPQSSTYYLGPFGLVPYFMSSELFTDSDQAYRAAAARLPLVTAPHAQISLEAECNPALDAFDTVSVALPRRLRGQTEAVERQMLRTLSVPLTSDGTQSMTTASSSVDVPGSNG